MKHGRIITAVGVLLAAAAAAGLAALLIMSLVTEFSPKPTRFANTEWVSEDGAFTLTVGEYDEDSYQCRAELVYTAPDGTTSSYTVADGAHSIIGVYSSEDNIDKWLRVKCNGDAFTARVNRTAELEYSGAYEKNEKVTFNRVSR